MMNFQERVQEFVEADKNVSYFQLYSFCSKTSFLGVELFLDPRFHRLRL